LRQIRVVMVHDPQGTLDYTILAGLGITIFLQLCKVDQNLPFAATVALWIHPTLVHIYTYTHSTCLPFPPKQNVQFEL
jgi:hypothetical protein